jgi:hypothetical protein
MLPRTFLSLRSFVPALVDQLGDAFGAAVPSGEYLTQLLGNLQLPSSAPTEETQDDDASTGGAAIDALDVIGFTQLSASFDGNQLTLEGTLDVIEGYEPTVPLPGVSQLSLVVTRLGRVTVMVSREKASLAVVGPSLALRFDESWLSPARPDTADPFAEIELAEIGWFSIDTDGVLGWGAVPGGQLRFVTNNDPWRIGSTSVTLETGTLSISLQNGLVVTLDEATLRFADDLSSKEPEGFALSLTGARIDRNGFTGAASIRFDDTHVDNPAAPTTFMGSGAGSLFDLDFGAYSIEIDIQQNVPVRAEVRGGLIMPFFDTAVDCTVMIAEGGDFEIALAGSGGGALVKLTKPQLLELALTGFSVKRVEKVTTFSMSGSMEFLRSPGELSTMPKFTLKNLSINSKGQVRLEKAWVDFNPGLSIDLIGFTLTVFRAGIALEDGDITVSITGVCALANGLPQAGVEELSVTIPRDGGNLRFALTGLSIDATIGGQVQFYGRFKMLQGDLKGFEGDLALTLIKPGLAIEGSMLVGMDTVRGFAFLYIYVAVELPAGIVVGPNVAIFGFAGLFGYNVRPSREEGQHWFYDWYRGAPAPGVTQSTKWKPEADKFAFGAGITFGTADGYTVVARALLVITSDLLMIEGRAGFLTERTNLGENPALRMLVVFEPGESVFLAIDAQYEFVENVLFAQGVVEAFFPFHDGDWYVYLGKDDPASKRIVADVLKRLFRADAYVMITSENTRFGGGIGYGLKKKFGPVGVEVNAGIVGHGELSYSPIQLTAGLSLVGKLKLRAFGAGLTVSLSSNINVRIPRPFLLSMDFEAEMSLPWPLPDVEVEFSVTWEETGTPAYADPIVTGAASMSNVGTSTIQFVAGTPAEMIPLDARIAITFAHAMTRADGFQRVLNLPQANVHAVSDTHKYRYRIIELWLDRVDATGGSLETFDLGAANSPIWANWQILDGMDEEGGTPAETSKAPGGSLLLMARSPFAWVRNRFGPGWNGADAPVDIPSYDAAPIPDATETTLDVCMLWGPDPDWTPSDGENGLGEPDPTLPTRTTTPDGTVVVVHGFPEPGSDDGGPTVYTDPTDQPFGVDVRFPEPMDVTDVTLVPDDGEIVITDNGGPGKDVPDPDEKPEPSDRHPPSDERCRRCWLAIFVGVLVTALAMLVLLLFASGWIAPRLPRSAALYVLLLVLLVGMVSIVWLLVRRACCRCCCKVRLGLPAWLPWPPKLRLPSRILRLWRRPVKQGINPTRKRVAELKESVAENRRRVRRNARALRRSHNGAELGLPLSGDTLHFVGKRLKCGSISYTSSADRIAHDVAVVANDERIAYASSYVSSVQEMFESPAFVLTPNSTYRLKCTVQKEGRGNTAEEHTWEFRTQSEPPATLAPYVYENVPATLDIPHFRSYPIAVAMSENYINTMYEVAAALPLEIVVVDSAGSLQVTRSSEWRKSPWHIDREGELAFVNAVNAIYGSAFDPANIPGDDVLVSYANDPDGEAGALAPDNVYDAHVRFKSDTLGERPLHTMRFRTSRFRDLEHWAADMSGDVVDYANPGIPDATWDAPGLPSESWAQGEEPFEMAVIELIPLIKEPAPTAPFLRLMRRANNRPILILTAPEPLAAKQFSFVLSTLPAVNPPAPREPMEMVVSYANPGPRPIGVCQDVGPMNGPANPMERMRRAANTTELARRADVDVVAEVIPARVIEIRIRWLSDGTRAFLMPLDAAEQLDREAYDLEIRFTHRVPSSSGQCVVDSVVRRLTMP